VLIVHFPIALLLIAPLFMVLGMLLPRRMPGLALAAWLLLLLGTVAAWFAVASGHAAFDATIVPEAAQSVAERHASMGETTRNIFSTLCAAYGVVLLVPVLFKRVKAGPWRVVGTLVVLAAFVPSAIYLSNTAHLGGRLVHEFGVQAILSDQPAEPAAPPATSAASESATRP
jgi:uncharacterized membrane protein